jgi:putative transposase
MLVEIPSKMSLSSFMRYIKWKSSLMIFEKWGNMKYKYRNREFWCRGYYVDTVGKILKKQKIYSYPIAGG